MALSKRQILTAVGGLAVLAAAGWLAWQYFEESASSPPAPPVPRPIVRPAVVKKKAPAPPNATPGTKPTSAPTAAVKAPSPAQATVAGQTPKPTPATPAARTAPTAAIKAPPPAAAIGTKPGRDDSSTQSALAPEATRSTATLKTIVSPETPEPARAQAPAPHASRAAEDARSCLLFATNPDVRKCAEQFR